MIKNLIYPVLLLMLWQPVYAQLPILPDVHEELQRAITGFKTNIPVENKLSYYTNSMCSYCSKVSETDSTDGTVIDEASQQVRKYAIYNNKFTQYDMTGGVKLVKIERFDRSNDKFASKTSSTEEYSHQNQKTYYLVIRRVQTIDSMIVNGMIQPGVISYKDEQYFFGRDSLLYMKELTASSDNGRTIFIPVIEKYTYAMCKGKPYLKTITREEKKQGVPGTRVYTKTEYKLTDSSNGLSFRKLVTTATSSIKDFGMTAQYDTVVLKDTVYETHGMSSYTVYKNQSKPSVVSSYDAKTNMLKYETCAQDGCSLLSKKPAGNDCFDVIIQRPDNVLNYKLCETWKTNAYELILPVDVNSLRNGMRSMPGSFPGKLVKFRYMKYVERY